MERERIEVTDELVAAWRDFHDDGKSEPIRDPNPSAPGVDGWSDGITLAGLQRVIERDRARVLSAQAVV